MLFCSCLFGRMYLCVLPSSFTSKLCTGSIYVTESWFSAKSLPNSRAQRDELKATFEAKPWNSPDGIQWTDWRPDHSNNRKPNVFHFPLPPIQWPILLSRLDHLVLCPWSPIACKWSKLLANPAHMVHSCWPSQPYTCTEESQRNFNLNSERKHKHFLRAKNQQHTFGHKTKATKTFEPAGRLHCWSLFKVKVWLRNTLSLFSHIPITTHDSGDADSCCLFKLGPAIKTLIT